MLAQELYLPVGYLAGGVHIYWLASGARARTRAEARGADWFYHTDSTGNIRIASVQLWLGQGHRKPFCT